jgi:osmoprotectant transport system permease protein
MLGEALMFLLDPGNWLGSDGIFIRLLEHLWYSVAALGIAAVVAVPAGIIIGHTGRGSVIAVGAANVLRALPSLGLMTFLVLIIGLGVMPPVLALVALAIPPLLAGVYSGIQNVDRAAVDAARAMGMSEPQIVVKVELPLALPLIVNGVRNAMLQLIATAMIAAYVNLGGIGRYIFDGLSVYDYGRMLVGAILVTLLALIVDGILAILGGLVGPKRSRADRVSGRRRAKAAPEQLA